LAVLTRRAHRGFSVAESLIAFIVLIVAVLTLTSTYTYSQSRITLRADELQAVTFGQQYLESVRQQVRGGIVTPLVTPAPTTQPIDSGYAIFSGDSNYSSSSPAPELPSAGTFTATGTVTQIGTTSDYDVSVDVTWPYSGVTQTVTLGTVVTTQVP
jgi:type II secretory pathway pseudopilin PulG